MNVDQEIYNIVDENDRVIGKASRKHIHQNNLLHRSVHILVFNSQKELYLQKRSLSKDENPGLWDTSSAGHVDAGESYDDCACRELLEELNIKADLTPYMKIAACQETYGEHVQVYTCVTDETIQFNPEEISEGAFFDLLKIKNDVSTDPDKFTSSFKLLFKQILIDETFFPKEN
ncbi:MAG: NUDIX domain-containing protein [Nitrospinae bacterium]|nr:NUDIX domain-containing protein [Nitrospinota bacterium]